MTRPEPETVFTPEYLIEMEIKNLRQEEEEESLRQRRVETALVKRRAEIQSRCPHTKTQYHPDPSGNNGSWSECLICGMDS